MKDCPFCLAERRGFHEPCPHDAILAIEALSRAHYASGLRAGMTALLDLLIVVDGHQEQGKRRRPIPIDLMRSSIVTKLGDMLRAAEKAQLPQLDAWRTEARKAAEKP